MTSPFLDAVETYRCETFVFQIFMAGSIDDAKRHLVRIAATEGVCWSVEPTEFIYSGGRELGFVVTSINYPRFPSVYEDLEKSAIQLAHDLMIELGQGSCSVVGPSETVWLTRRKS
jgi:hypothetical protein